MMMSRMKVGLAAIVGVIGAMGAAAQGQTWSGSYVTAGGVTVRWTVSIRYGADGWGFYNRTERLETIEGPDRELVETGEGAAAPEGPTAKRAVDLARMFLRGELTSAAMRAHVAGCTDPECAHSEVVEGVGDSSSVDGAIGAYGVHLAEHPEDWIAVREFALALLAARRDADAVEVMADAYRAKPEIGLVPVNPGLFGEDRPRALRELVVRAVRHAHRVETGEAWLLVAVLMQSEGRTERALEMLERALEHGLDQEVGAGLRGALGGNP